MVRHEAFGSHAGRDPFVGAPVTLNALQHTDYKSSQLEVYLAIRSFTSLSPANENFARCFPSIESIGKKFGHTNTTVCEAIAWLEANSYLYKKRRRRESNLYTILLRRDWFIQVRQLEGTDRAKELYEEWLDEQREEARTGIAAGVSRPRNRASSPEPLKSDRKDIKTASLGRGALEVIPSGTSRGLPTEKSSSEDPDLDPEDLRPSTRETPDLDVGGKAPTALLPPGPFSKRKDLLDLDPGNTPEEWDARVAIAKAKAARMLEEEEAKKKGGPET